MLQLCSSTCRLPETDAFFHLNNCKVCCSECYYGKVCRAGNFKHLQNCWLGRVLENRSNGSTSGSVARQICRSCDKSSLKERQSRCEARDRADVERLAQLPLACSRCHVFLPMRGPCWWVCSECFSECRDDVHPPRVSEMEV
jgi:hypothetical protein